MHLPLRQGCHHLQTQSCHQNHLLHLSRKYESLRLSLGAWKLTHHACLCCACLRDAAHTMQLRLSVRVKRQLTFISKDTRTSCSCSWDALGCVGRSVPSLRLWHMGCQLVVLLRGS